MAQLRTDATSILKRPFLPALPTYHEEPIHFSPEDIAKIIEQLTTKGSRYAQLRKTFSP